MMHYGLGGREFRTGNLGTNMEGVGMVEIGEGSVVAAMMGGLFV